MPAIWTLRVCFVRKPPWRPLAAGGTGGGAVVGLNAQGRERN